MKRHWAYLKYVLRHKYYVFVEGRRLHVPIHLLILHDWTKFLPKEWIPYVNYFYGEGRTRESLESYNADIVPDEAFEYAWNHHQKANKHHWQYWVRVGDDGTLLALPMPHDYIREMLADWKGAGRAVGKPNTQAWYVKNKDKMTLHPYTRDWVEVWLGVK